MSKTYTGISCLDTQIEASPEGYVLGTIRCICFLSEDGASDQQQSEEILGEYMRGSVGGLLRDYKLSQVDIEEYVCTENIAMQDAKRNDSPRPWNALDDEEFRGWGRNMKPGE